jgi:hypothetical protein
MSQKANRVRLHCFSSFLFQTFSSSFFPPFLLQFFCVLDSLFSFSFPSFSCDFSMEKRERGEEKVPSEPASKKAKANTWNVCLLCIFFTLFLQLMFPPCYSDFLFSLICFVGLIEWHCAAVECKEKGFCVEIQDKCVGGHSRVL